MTAAVHVLTGPAGSGKTRRLAERYRALAGSGVGAVLWLGPTHRHVEALRERLAGGGAAWLAPNLFTFQDFAEEVVRVNDPAARPLAEAQRCLLTEAVVAELHGRKEVTHFRQVVETRGFSEAVFALLAELKHHGIRPADLARAAYRRGYAGNRVARTVHGRKISHKDRECARIYAGYERRVCRQRLYDLEGRVWHARDLLRSGARRPFERVRGVFVDGVSDFEPGEAYMSQ